MPTVYLNKIKASTCYSILEWPRQGALVWITCAWTHQFGKTVFNSLPANTGRTLWCLVWASVVVSIGTKCSMKWLWGCNLGFFRQHLKAAPAFRISLPSTFTVPVCRLLKDTGMHYFSRLFLWTMWVLQRCDLEQPLFFFFAFPVNTTSCLRQHMWRL